MVLEFKLPSVEEIATAGKQLYEQASELATQVQASSASVPAFEAKSLLDSNRSLYVEAPASPVESGRGEGLKDISFKPFEKVKSFNILEGLVYTSEEREKIRLTAGALDLINLVAPVWLKQKCERWFSGISPEDCQTTIEAWGEILLKAGVKPDNNTEFSYVLRSFLNTSWAEEKCKTKTRQDSVQSFSEIPKASVGLQTEIAYQAWDFSKYKNYIDSGLKVFLKVIDYASCVQVQTKIAEFDTILFINKETSYFKEYKEGPLVVLERLKENLEDPNLKRQAEAMLQDEVINSILKGYYYFDLELRTKNLIKLAEELKSKNLPQWPLLIELNRPEYGEKAKAWIERKIHPNFAQFIFDRNMEILSNPQEFLKLAGGVVATGHTKGILRKFLIFVFGETITQTTLDSLPKFFTKFARSIKYLIKGEAYRATVEMGRGLDQLILQFPDNFLAFFTKNLSTITDNFKFIASPVRKISNIAEVLLGTSAGIARDWVHAVFKIPSDFFDGGALSTVGGLFGRLLLNPVVRLAHALDNTFSEFVGITDDVTQKVLDEKMKNQLYAFYGDSLNLQVVRIKLGNIINKLSSEAAPRTIGNNIFLRESWGYQVFDDKGKLTDAGRKLVMHEMAHIWQHRKDGGDYICKSAWHQFSAWKSAGDRNDAYNWQKAIKNKNIRFSDLNPEQQANVLELINWLIAPPLKVALDKASPKGISYDDPHTGTRETISDEEREFLHQVYLDFKADKL